MFIRLQMKAGRLDLVMVWPRVEALSWACVSGRIWQPHTCCRHHFWVLTNSCRKPAWTHPKGWGADVEPGTCAALINSRQVWVKGRVSTGQQVWKWKLSDGPQRSCVSYILTFKFSPLK